MLLLLTAATISIPFTDPTCTNGYTVTGTVPNQALVCAGGPPPAVPVCVVTGPSTGQVGTQVPLVASCNPAATSYAWTGGNCAGITLGTCQAGASAAGVVDYTVRGTNASGPGSVSPAFPVTWQSSGPPSACTNISGPTVIIHIPWPTDNSQYPYKTADYGNFTPEGGLILWWTTSNVPNSTPGLSGVVKGVEYNSPPTGRDTALSSQPCDFTGTYAFQKSGSCGKTKSTNDQAPATGLTQGTTTTQCQLAEQPSTTYYYNIKNSANNCGGSNSCAMIWYFQKPGGT